MGFESEDECTDAYTLGLADPEDNRECIIESLADMAEPPPIVDEYYACELNPLDPALQCMEEDLEAGYCNRADEMGAFSRRSVFARSGARKYPACDE